MMETEQLIILWCNRLLSQFSKIKLSCSSIMWLDGKNIFELHTDLRHNGLQSRSVSQEKQGSLKTELQLVQHA